MLSRLIARPLPPLVLLALFLSASAAFADTYTYTYNVTLDDGIESVSDIVFLQSLVEGSSTGRGSTWSYSLPSGSSEVFFNWPTYAPPIEETIGIGLAYGAPGDPDPTLAVFGNFAPSQIGQSFSSLFPDSSESSLIAGLLDVNSLVPGDGPTSTNGFAVPFYNDAFRNDGLGLPPNTSFDVLAFSNGEVIGTGELTVTLATPEPSTLSLLLLGTVLIVPSCRRAPHS